MRQRPCLFTASPPCRAPLVGTLVLVSSILLVSACAKRPAAPARSAAVPDWKDPVPDMPLFPSEPVPGHPGADPAAGRPAWDRPEFVNYPGSVEHFRVDNQRYIEPRNARNHRSLVRNFRAVDLPGVKPEAKETFAEPVHYVLKGTEPGLIRTGQFRPPVPVVRLQPGGQRLQFRLPPLPRSMYVVRVIGALETASVADPPRELILEARINDGPGGTTNRYVVRQRGTDNFYSLGEFFFHAEDRRPFTVDVGLHPDSQVDLLVHNVDVHDVLAECARRGGKRRAVLLHLDTLRSHWDSDFARGVQQEHAAVVTQRLQALRKELPNLSDEELQREWRRRRDDILWYSLPPLNQHFVTPVGQVSSRPDPATAAELAARGLLAEDSHFGFGWGADSARSWRLNIPPPWGGVEWIAPWEIVHTGADGKRTVYSWEDLRALRPLPLLPFAVHPWGKRFESAEGNVSFFFPQAQAVSTALYRTLLVLAANTENEGVYLWRNYLRGGNREYARDFALLLCRLAYDLPSYVPAHSLGCILTSPSNYFWRHLAHQHLGRVSYQFIEWQNLAVTYDHLFHFIQNNQELAEAVGRYVSWVRTPSDVIELLDTYLLQYGAKQMMYFEHYYNHEHAGMLATMAAIQNDPEIAEPWVRFIFRRTWEYPHRPASVADYLYTSTQRDGTSTIGSSFYTLGGGIGVKAAKWLDTYVRAGGDPRYSLSDLRRFPRVAAGPYFAFEGRVAGLHPLGVGDVGGPCTAHGAWFESVAVHAGAAWRWTRDPRFAWLLVHHGKRTSESDAEWVEITAAARETLNPFFSNRSRVLSDWGGILEGGTDSTDFRFRHAARIRVGTGTGHAHSDTLDLGLWSLGLIMAGDCGGRPGYGRPAVESSLVHNLVTVDGQNWQGHAWVSDLADLGDVQYLRARGNYQGLFARQVSLIEMDSGEPPSRLPRAYFLDVFRVVGGREHAYNFHGPPEDEFSVNIPREELTAADREWLKGYVIEGEQQAGTVSADPLVVTWRMAREPKRFEFPGRGQRVTRAAEPAILGSAYDPASPRKYLRVHLPGQTGSRFRSGLWISAPYGSPERTDGETFRQAHVVRNAASGQAASLFAAVWEPFAGEPFLRSVRLEASPDDPHGPAAVHIETVDGVRELVFADMADGPMRTLADGTRLQAQFALLSRDGSGLRRACVVGGLHCETAELVLRPAVRDWQGQVRTVDYLDKRVTLDAALPAEVLDGVFFEVGRPTTAVGGGPAVANGTSFQAVKVEPRGTHTELVWRKGADVFAGKIVEVNLTPAAKGTVAEITVEFAPSVHAGANRPLVATNEKGQRQWRCEVRGNVVHLYGEPVGPTDFAVGDHLRLWDFGHGDLWRTPGRISIRRDRPGLYQVRANAPFELSIQSSRAAWSADGTVWRPLAPPAADGRQTWSVGQSELKQGKFLLRWAEQAGGGS